MPQHSNDVSENNFSERIREKVRIWLMEDGWSLRQETAPQTIWTYVAEDRLGRKLLVGQSVDREDQLIIQGGVKVDDAIQTKMAQLSEDERNDFLWELRFELLRTQLEFDGIQIPLERVDVTQRIFFDALTKDAFLQRASQVRKGILIVQWMLGRKFMRQAPPRPLGFQT